MRYIFICLFFLVSSTVSAKQLWLDDDWNTTTKAKAEFYSQYDDSAANDAGLYAVKVYYADTQQLRFEGAMKDPSNPAKSIAVGPYKFFYANGQLESDGQYSEDGEFTGPTRIFNKDGSLNRIMEMKAGKINGEVRYFNYDGTLHSSYQYLDGITQGPYKLFGHDGTTVIEEGQYIDDKKEGEYIKYWRGGNGNIREKGTYHNDKINGVTTRYRRDGTKQWSVPYVDGQLEGTSRNWDSEGNLIGEQQYHNSKENGLSQKWDKHGLLTEIEHYKNRNLVGERLTYFEGTEQIKTQEQYNDQHQKLSRITYNKDGSKYSETHYDVTQDEPISDYKQYKNGSLVVERKKDPNRKWSQTQIFDESGNRIGLVTSKNRRKEGKYLATNQSLDDDSQYIRTEGNFKHGTLHGEYKQTLLPDNIVLEEGRYDEGEKVGEWHSNEGDRLSTKHYDANGQLDGEQLSTTLDGKLLHRTHYRHGQQVGFEERRTPDGIVMAKGQYVDGERHGDWIMSDGWYNVDKIWRGTFNHGVRVGKWRATDAAGYVREVGKYDQQGRRQGQFYSYHSSGELYSLRTYRDDIIREQTMFTIGEASTKYIYDEKGHEIEEIDLTEDSQ